MLENPADDWKMLKKASCQIQLLLLTTERGQKKKLTSEAPNAFRFQ